MFGQLIKKLRETLLHMLPLTLMILGLDLLLVISGGAMPGEVLARFGVGALLLLIGLTLIDLGAELSLVPMGERIGAFLSSIGKYPLLIICSFLIGALVTVAEPDIAVFASQFPHVADRNMIFTIAAGAGVFLVLGVIRVIKRIPLQITLIVFYAAAFVLAEFAPDSFVGVAFDSGGVAMGVILVPFIMSLGIGLATVRGGKSSVEDIFGTVAVCAIGPVMAMLLLGLFGGGANAEAGTHHPAAGGSVLSPFIHALPLYIEEVAVALAPIIIFFLLFQQIFLHLHKKTLTRTAVGLLYSFIGHALFLTGVSIGFLPAGEHLGGAIASLPGSLRWLIIPIGMLMGYFVVMAEPAVRVMNSRVEELTVGAVTKRAMRITVSIGAAVSAGIAMLRVMTGVPLRWFLIAGYAVSLGLSFFVPKLFTAIAFDSGGVASGALALVFMLPFARGADIAVTGGEEHLLTDAFGLMALVAMTPLITIQVMGLIYAVKLRRASAAERARDDSVTIIEFDTEGL